MTKRELPKGKELEEIINNSNKQIEIEDKNKSIKDKIKELENEVLALSKAVKEVKEKGIAWLTLYKISSYGYVSSIEWEVTKITDDSIFANGKNDDGCRGYTTHLNFDKELLYNNGFIKQEVEGNIYYFVDVFKNVDDKIEFILDILKAKKKNVIRDIEYNEKYINDLKIKIKESKIKLKEFDDYKDEDVIKIYRDLSFNNTNFGVENEEEFINLLPRKLTV